MHADELSVDGALVRRLLLSQFRQWADLPLAPVVSSGTDNAIYRLGDQMSVRLPRIERAAAQVEKEQRWLPELAPHLPLAVPVPVAMGIPAEGYPWPWSVYRWLEGEDASRRRITDMRRAATQLAELVSALHGIQPAGGPPPGIHNFHRGVPLAARDASTRAAIAFLASTFDAGALTAVWEDALRAPVWEGRPAWIHGDLSPANLVVVDGRLTGVIDFGGLAMGDPACDLIVAWNLLTDETRHVFREALSVDEAAWARGRGWALSVAVIAIPYYEGTNPAMVAGARRTVDEVLGQR